MKKALIYLAKYLLPLVIIAGLLTTVSQQQWTQLAARIRAWTAHEWSLMFGSLALVFSAVCITFVRWFLLVRALDLPFRLRDAFRLGFLCHLLNFVGIGSAGGDLFKAFFIAREQPGRRAAAVSTVVVDRVIGFYALLIVTSTAIVVADLSNTPAIVQTVCDMTLTLTVVGALVIGVFLMPGLNASRITGWLIRIPKLGHLFAQLASSLRVYRDKPAILLISGTMSIGVHIALATAVYLSARALYDSIPTFSQHFIVVPLASVAGAIPLTPAGVGTFEAAFSLLFNSMIADPNGEGTIIALVYRLMLIMVAAIGMVYYWSSRKEVGQLLDQAERQQQAAIAPTRAN